MVKHNLHRAISKLQDHHCLQCYKDANYSQRLAKTYRTRHTCNQQCGWYLRGLMSSCRMVKYHSTNQCNIGVYTLQEHGTNSSHRRFAFRRRLLSISIAQSGGAKFKPVRETALASCFLIFLCPFTHIRDCNLNYTTTAFRYDRLFLLTRYLLNDAVSGYNYIS
jgi:hypothetical protein